MPERDVEQLSVKYYQCILYKSIHTITSVNHTREVRNDSHRNVTSSITWGNKQADGPTWTTSTTSQRSQTERFHKTCGKNSYGTTVTVRKTEETVLQKHTSHSLTTTTKVVQHITSHGHYTSIIISIRILHIISHFLQYDDQRMDNTRRLARSGKNETNKLAQTKNTGSKAKRNQQQQQYYHKHRREKHTEDTQEPQTKRNNTHTWNKNMEHTRVRVLGNAKVNKNIWRPWATLVSSMSATRWPWWKQPRLRLQPQ